MLFRYWPAYLPLLMDLGLLKITRLGLAIASVYMTRWAFVLAILSFGH